MNETYVWVVQNYFDDTPTLMSIHSDKDKAFAARDAYIKDERNGGTANDYWVHAVRVD